VNNKKKRVRAIDSLVKACIKKEWFSGALEAAKLGASQKVIDSLVETFIKKGWLSKRSYY